MTRTRSCPFSSLDSRLGSVAAAAAPSGIPRSQFAAKDSALLDHTLLTLTDIRFDRSQSAQRIPIHWRASVTQLTRQVSRLMIDLQDLGQIESRR